MQESLAEWARDGIWIRGEASPAGAQDAQVDLGGKERDVETVGRDGVAGGAGDPIDEALEPQATQVVAHATRCVRGWVETEEPGDQGAQVAVAKAAWQMGEAAQALEERHNPGVAKAQAWSSGVSFEGGVLQPVQRILAEDTGPGDALDLQELAVDLDTGGAEVRQVNHGLARVKIAGVVNRGLGPQSPFLLEVLLDVRMLVLDVQDWD